MIPRERRLAWELGALWAGMPLYPSFISLLPIAPPGLSLLGPPAALAAALAVALLTLVVAFETRAEIKRMLASDALTRAILVYVGVVFAVSLAGIAPLIGCVFAAIALCTWVGFVALRSVGRSPIVVRAMTQALLWSSALASLVALVTQATRRPAELYAVGNGRAIGTFVVPGELAGYLCMLVPFALGVALTANTRRMRMLAGVVCAIDVGALLASVSRAGIVALAIACALWPLFCGHRRIGAIALGALALGAALAAPHFNLHHNPSEDFNRPSIWIAALREITLFPLTGTGPGGFSRVYPLVRLPAGEAQALHAHDFLLTTLAETGVVGAAALAAMWITFIRAFRAGVRGATPRARLAGYAVVTGFLATWLQSVIDVVQILFLGLWIPFMGMALIALEEAIP